MEYSLMAFINAEFHEVHALVDVVDAVKCYETHTKKIFISNYLCQVLVN